MRIYIRLSLMSLRTDHMYYQAIFDTPLGAMQALADQDTLHFLDFTDRVNFDRQKQRVLAGDPLVRTEQTPVLQALGDELDAYFTGDLQVFNTPMTLYGSAFQQTVMQSLRSIAYGATQSYGQQASIIGRPSAVRAVARANSMNQIAVLIPCHRVIGADGRLTGYAGGIARKKWLLDHEKKYTI